MPRIVLNAAKCNHCNTLLVSESVHDFKSCKCGRISVDGGKEYIKRSFIDKNDYTDKSIYFENGEYHE